jgi:hypothetical protein
VGAAKFSGKGALSLGRGALDFIAYSTFDSQGKRPKVEGYLAEHDEQVSRLNNLLAIMDAPGEDRRAA